MKMVMLTRTCGESHNRCHTHWDWRWCKLIDEEKMLTKPGGACADECLLRILKQQKMLTKLAGEKNRFRAHWDWRSCLALRLRSLWSRLFLSVYRIFFFLVYIGLFWFSEGVQGFVSVFRLRSLWIGSLLSVYTSFCGCIWVSFECLRLYRGLRVCLGCVLCGSGLLMVNIHLFVSVYRSLLSV